MDRAIHMKLEKSCMIFALLLLVVAAIFTAVRSGILFGEAGM